MMHEKDLAAKEFFNRPFIIADLCNCVIFDGHRVVMPEDVIILGTELTSGPLDLNGEKLPADSVRFRDSYSHISYRRKRRKKREEFELGLEFQSFGDKNVVIRSHEYDGRSQAMKVTIWKRNKDNTICPVITIYINLTGRPWRYPCSLQGKNSESFSFGN